MSKENNSKISMYVAENSLGGEGNCLEVEAVILTGNREHLNNNLNLLEISAEIAQRQYNWREIK